MFFFNYETLKFPKEQKSWYNFFSGHPEPVLLELSKDDLFNEYIEYFKNYQYLEPLIKQLYKEITLFSERKYNLDIYNAFNSLDGQCFNKYSLYSNIIVKKLIEDEFLKKIIQKKDKAIFICFLSKFKENKTSRI